MGKIEDLADRIQEMISGARETVAQNINTELLMTYWRIGQLIVQNEADDNEPIGIILCAAKNEIVAEYALGGLNNQIFVSKYVYYLPNKEELVGQVQRAIENYDEEKQGVITI